MMKTYNIEFQGYWRDANKDGIPSESGVYLVYRSRYNNETNTIGLIEIIYIGQSNDVHDRIVNHDQRKSFEETLKAGEELAFAIAPILEEELDIVEQSLIFAQKPELNDLYKDNYQQEDAAFKIGGNCIGLKYTDYTITK
ncbi:MAG: GIY-YIG nuclease family protein [Muribaculaceae bacterium]|nr:GIY-YIG nuclease family protein [Muribaculaceae bacterium]